MDSRLAALTAELTRVHRTLTRLDADCAAFVAAIPDSQQASARNLLHYLALRSHDLRRVQLLLASHGLSSLGRTESHVRHGVETVLNALHALQGTPSMAPTPATALSREEGDVLLAAHTDALLGAPRETRAVRIMVTMPSEAASDYVLVRDLVDGGMDCMRVNCAHDDIAAWKSMADHLKRANHELGRACRLCMDIAGPKLRTASLVPGPSVIKIKPQRDALGAVTRPAAIALVAAGCRRGIAEAMDAILELDDRAPASVEAGDTIEFDDARGKTRRLRVRAHQNGVVVAELERTAYVVTGTTLRFRSRRGAARRRVVAVPSTSEPITLQRGDTLLLTRDSEVGRPAVRDDRGRVLMPARIGITLHEVFRDVRPGESVWFDDGRIGGVIRETTDDQISVEITQAKPDGSRLGAEKGVNLPDSHLRLAALTPADVENLAFIAQHADLIGYSFVRSADDILQLQRLLADLDAAQLGIILKVETRQAFAELPKLLFACMRGGPFGVMIARGDLAVECGFERLAEVQEEILWIWRSGPRSGRLGHPGTRVVDEDRHAVSR